MSQGLWLAGVSGEGVQVCPGVGTPLSPIFGSVGSLCCHGDSGGVNGMELLPGLAVGWQQQLHGVKMPRTKG